MRDPVLVTGARGFLGRALLVQLHRLGLQTHGTTRGELPADLTGLATFHRLALDSVKGWKEIVAAARPRTVFHLAGSVERLSSPTAIADYAASMVSTAAKLVESLEGREIDAIIFLGSGEEYGAAPVPYREDAAEKPLTSYGLAKLAVTAFGRQLRALGWPIVTVRPAVVYGHGQSPSSFLYQLIHAAREGSVLKMSPGDQTRDFVHILDAVAALLLAAETPSRADVVNVGSGTELSLRRAVDVARSILPCPLEVEFGALPYRSGEPMRYALDNTRMREAFGWEPQFSFEEGLRDLWERSAGGT